VVGILIWKPKDWSDASSRQEPYLRIYDPCNPENGWALKKPDGRGPSFKDYKLMTLIDPSIKIIDEHDHFSFVERENGEMFLDFNLPDRHKT
jgi:hypothetical protein